VALLLSIFVHKISHGTTIYIQMLYYLILGIHLVKRMREGGYANIISPDICFLAFYTLVHLGYMSLYSLRVVPYSTEVIYFDSGIPDALLAINIGLIGFLFGSEIFCSRNKKIIQSHYVAVPRRGWGGVGLVFMFTGLLFHLLGLYTLGYGLISQYGYAAIGNVNMYTNSKFTIYSLQLSVNVMVLGIVIYSLYSALRYQKLFKSKIAMVTAVSFILLMILEGDRGPVLKFGLPILFVRHYFIKQIKVKYLLIMFLGLGVLFAAIGVSRTVIFSPSSMLKEYQYQKGAGGVAWYSPFVELGSSFNTLNITVHEVPSAEPYWKGASWRDALIHIVPFLQGYTLRKGISTWQPSQWVTTTYWGEERAGRAFTVVAEGYLNFGFIGVFMELFLLGAFLRWLTIMFSKNPSAFWGFIMLGCMGPVILSVRNHLNLVTNVCMQVFVLSFLLNIFFGNDPEESYKFDESDECQTCLDYEE